MQKKFKGIIVPLVTPLSKDGQIDIEGLERLLGHVVDGGVDGVFILGTTGEGPCISREGKHTLIKQTNFYLKGRTKLLVGITDTSPDESVNLAHIAAEQGADTVVVAPPSYFPFTQEELYEYIRFIARESPLPAMLYNIPKMTKTSFGVETIDRLTEEDKITGFKDSSKDMGYFREILTVTGKRPDWSVLIGYEDLLAGSVEAGGDGGVLAGGNIYPQLLVKLYHAIIGNDREEIKTIEGLLLENRKIYALGPGATSAIQAIKYALELKGICGRTMSGPFKGLDDTAGVRVRKVFKSGRYR
jgi:dihydrodipicolinate synthase/N-acetylneuraminate lyase